MKGRPYGQPRRCLDVTKTKDLFGFKAAHRLRDGIPKTICWFMTHQDQARTISFA